ncbi:MAG: IS5 family transposase, partial [Pseudomonadota bacterium]
LRALLLQAFFTIRSERQLMEQLDFNMLFRWFVGLGLDDRVWDASTFCKNRDRLLGSDASAKVLSSVITHKKVRRLLSRDHFSVDGTMVEAWASMKSFKPKNDDGRCGGGGASGVGRNEERDFHGERRTNDTHASTTDPDARLHRKGKGKESKLCFMGHALMENRNGLVVGGTITQASGTAERDAALEMIDTHRATTGRDGQRRITLGGDKGFDVAGFVDDLRARKVTPHMAVQDHVTKTGKRRKTRIDGRTTRHPGYEVSQRIRKRIEEIFGWLKVNAGQDKTRFRGKERVNASFVLALAAYNLIRLPKLLESPQ